MKKRMVAFDLDGTLLNDEGLIDMHTREALLRAKKQGIIISYVTGRNIWDMKAMDRGTDLEDYLIINNGARVYDVKAGKIIYDALLNRNECEKLIKYCLREKYQLYVISDKSIKVNKLTWGALEYYDHLGFPPDLYHSLEDIDLSAISVFLVSTDGKAVCKFVEAECPSFLCLNSQPGCIDIIDRSVGKWKGILMLLKYLKMDSSQVVTVGNYTNDIEMIEKAGIGVAVRNSLPGVIASADYVTMADNNHNMAAEVLEKFLMKG